MSDRKQVLNDILKRQTEYLNAKMKLDKAKKDYAEREKAKFNKSLIEILTTPKKVDQNEKDKV